jgi:hypothetical protein
MTMQSSSSRREFIAGAAAASAALMGKLGHALGVNDGPAAHRPAAVRTNAGTSPAGVHTAVYTFDSNARVIAVSRPCDHHATTAGYHDA